MKDILVKDTAVKGLEYVFVPPGLRLVAKAPDKPASTSILVRGGAGTGKTTLALSLAHSIARVHGGSALYLTTEFVPTELTYKARLLGLAEGIVVMRGSTAERPEGAVEVEHLSHTDAGKDAATNEARRRAAIKAIRELLSSEKEARRPLRVVVIDGLGLAERKSSERALRDDLVALIHAIEQEGVSAVLVEEVIPQTGAWLPFVVDTVFELALSPDPDTGELVRKLMCPKSRYTRALPGPHDYGIEEERPALFPDPLPIVAEHAFHGQVKAPDLFFPVYSDDQYVSTHKGLILVSGPPAHSPIAHTLMRTPGVEVARVQCGAVTRIVSSPPNELFSSTLFATTQGPFAWGWAVIRAARRGQVNAVFIRDLHLYTSRARPRQAVLNVLEALRDLGVIVCLEDRPEDLAPLLPVADHVPKTKEIGERLRRKVLTPRIRSALSWLSDLRIFPKSRQSSPHELFGRRSLSADDISAIRVDLGAGFMELPDAMKLGLELDDISMAGTNTQLERVAALHQLGLTELSHKVLAKAASATSLAAKRAALQVTLGDDINAGRAILSIAADSSKVHQIWLGLCALYGLNDAALEQLQHMPMDDSVAFGLYLRALAVRHKFNEAERLVDQAAERGAWPAWFRGRITADLLLEPGVSEKMDQAVRSLRELATLRDIPPIHRADVFYNLGVLWDWMGHVENAEDAYARALQVNPHHSPARNRFELLTHPG